MKKIYISVILVFSTVLFTGCNWLDVHPVDEVDKASMYATTDGFYNVLNGVYLSIGAPEMYGENMTWGAMEAWGRAYALDKNNTSHEKLYSLQECMYDSKSVMALAESIWKNCYLNIARLNDFIQEANRKPENFFTNGDVERKLLIGEAMGLRAMIHFDLFRIFGESPSHPTDAEKAYVPYVDVYPSKSNPPTPVDEFMGKVEQDLSKAAEMVAAYDTTKLHRFEVLNQDQRLSDKLPEWGRFYSHRGARLNYYAIRILQSRVALYNKDYESASTFAGEILDLVNSKELKYTGSGKIATEPKFMSETLFSFYYDLLKEATQNKFDFTKPSCLKVEDYGIFTKVNGDKRKDMISNKVLNIYTNDSKEEYIPSIRFTEAFYIMGECLAHQDGKLIEAIDMFNKFRMNRGVYSASAKVSTDVTSEQFIKILIEDARREFAGLGQNVFIYKRLNLPVEYSEGVFAESKGNLRLGVPQSESAI